MKGTKQAERNDLTMPLLQLNAYLNKLRDDVTWKTLENQIEAECFDYVESSLLY